MAYRLWLSDGSLTVTLDDSLSGVFGVTEYSPRTPSVRVTTSPPQGDGTNVTEVTYDNVDETIHMFITGNPSQIRSVNTSINTLLERARKKISQVYLYLEVDTEHDPNNAWRSEIFYGRSVLDDDALRVWQFPDFLLFEIEIHRAHFWERVQEVELPLAKSNGSPTTGGITLQNTNDGSGKSHWFTVAANEIIGDLPARVRLEMTNTYSNANGSNSFYLGRSSKSPTYNQKLILEGEDGTTLFGGWVGDSNSSNGGIMNMVWTGTGATSILQWDLPSAFLGDTKGEEYRVIMRGSPSAGGWVRLVTRINGISPVQTTPWVQMNSWSMQEIGTIQLPPYKMKGGAAYPLTLYLEVRGLSVGANAMSVDYIALMPTESYRVLKSKGYQVPQGAVLVDDGETGEVYTWNIGSPFNARMGNYIPYGPPIELQPGVINSFYILCDAANTSHQIGRTTSVRMYVRPRRITI